VQVRGFVIHLARAAQRRAQVERLLAEAPCPTEVFDAVDGRAMAEVEVVAVLSDRPVMHPPYPFQIGRGELACFLSHRALWQRMVDEGIDQALILEDDVALEPGFAAAFALASRFVGVEGFVQFQTRPLRGTSEVVLQEDGVRVIRPRVVPRRTSAQLVGRRAAERLLAVSARIDRPVDGMLQLVWETGQAVHCVLPSGVSDMTAEVGGTTVQRKSGVDIVARLTRAYHRAVYRRAVQRLSRP
jgi:glycosyl transferase family 25